jgi:hypothetical protein
MLHCVFDGRRSPISEQSEMTLSAMGAVASSRWESIRSRLVQNRALAWPSRFYIRYVIKRKVARYRNRIVHHSYGGYDLAISLEDPVADEWYDHDWPLPSELARREPAYSISERTRAWSR